MGKRKPIRFFTPEEDQYIKDHWSMSDTKISRELQRPVSSVQKRRRFIVAPPGANKYRPHGNSIRDNHHPGPDGWKVECGPPCLLCIYQDCKFDAVNKYAFRRECRTCSARIEWDKHNGGRPQKPGYCEVIYDHYQTQELEIGF